MTRNQLVIQQAIQQIQETMHQTNVWFMQYFSLIIALYAVYAYFTMKRFYNSTNNTSILALITITWVFSAGLLIASYYV